MQHSFLTLDFCRSDDNFHSDIQGKSDFLDVCVLINMFVDTYYKLKIFKGKAHCAKCINAKLFCDLHAKLHAVITSGSPGN